MKTYPPEIDLIEMRRELDELRAKFAKLENGRVNRTDLESHVLTVTDRRGMMKKMAGMAVGVAAVGLVRPIKSSAGVLAKERISALAPSASGSPLIMGGANSATNPAGTSV